MIHMVVCAYNHIGSRAEIQAQIIGDCCLHFCLLVPMPVQTRQSPCWAMLVQLEPGSQPSTDGILKLSYTSRPNGKGWRCVFTYSDAARTRVFGTVKDTPWETVHAFLQRTDIKTAANENRNILEQVKYLDIEKLVAQASRSSQRQEDQQPAPRTGCTPPPPCPVSEKRRVSHIHNIYGLYRDDKQMSELFRDNHARWKHVAEVNGAHYHLWSADEVDTLIHDHYPEFLKMYKAVRYPVMRVDIGRIVILHRYGGLYSDLDVSPNRSEFTQYPLAFCKVPPGRLPKEDGFYDMEVIIAVAGHPLLIQWLKCIRDAITQRPWKSVFDAYCQRRMRYIYNTSGPATLKRFLKTVAPSQYTGIPMNRVSEFKHLTSDSKQQYDVLTRMSNTYPT